jgi:short-subunit dehydrogenase
MKKAIIIGASSGIGKGISLELLKKNYKIGISARREERLNEIKKINPENVIIKAFDSSTEKNDILLDYFIKKLEGVDLIIYCSGIGIINKELDYNKEKKVNNLNVSGFTQVITHAYNYFVKKGSGHIVNISSIASEIGNGIAPSYNASKAFQANYLQGLRFKSSKIKLPIFLTDVRPGFVDTDILMGNKDKLLWVAPLDKACKQIADGIDRKSKVLYITRRWKIISLLIKILPEKFLRLFF